MSWGLSREWTFTYPLGGALHCEFLGLTRGLDHVIDDPVVLRFVRTQVIVAIRILFHLLEGLPGMFRNRLVQRLAPAENFPRRNRDVRRLTARTTARLVDHHAAIR